MTVLEALAKTKQLLMNVETKGESSAYIVEVIKILTQIEDALTPALTNSDDAVETSESEEVEA